MEPSDEEYNSGMYENQEENQENENIEQEKNLESINENNNEIPNENQNEKEENDNVENIENSQISQKSKKSEKSEKSKKSEKQEISNSKILENKEEIPKKIIPPLDESKLWCICPKCKKFPIITPLIENGTALLKINCSCSPIQKYSYDEYINLLKEKKKKLMQCDMNSKHKIYNAVTYCFDCDKFLCSFCDTIHKKINPNHSTSDERTHLDFGCQRHLENNYIIGYCEDCNIHLCQTCFNEHDILHNIILFNQYFPKELADKTKEKFDIVRQEFERKLNQSRLKILEKIDEEGDIRNQLPFVEKVSNNNIKICNELTKIIQLLFDNYYNTIDNYLNYNIITNIKKLSNFNDKSFNYDDDIPLYKNIENFINFYKQNYLFKSTQTPFTYKNQFSSPGEIYSVEKLLPITNDRLVIGDWSGDVEIFDMNNKKLLGILYGHFLGITTMCYLKNGHLLTGSRDFSINEWDLETFDYIKSYPSHNDKVSKVLQIKDGKIITTGWDKKINIYDNNNDKLIKSIEESDIINDIIQLKNGHLLVCIKNKKIKELCPKTFNVLKEFDIQSNPINVIQLLDERIVVSCFDDKKKSSVKIINMKKWEIEKEFKEHNKIITSLYLLNDGRYVSTSLDGTAIVYSLEPDSVLCKYERMFKTGLNSCAQLRDNSIVLAGINDSLDILD